MTDSLAPDPEGLSSTEAQSRLDADGFNELPTALKRNLLRQSWDVVRQPMLLLLLGAGTVNFLLAEPLDGFILMSFVVVVIGISIYQEHKTENALAALRELSSPRALVARSVLIPRPSRLKAMKKRTASFVAPIVPGTGRCQKEFDDENFPDRLGFGFCHDRPRRRQTCSERPGYCACWIARRR